MNAPQSSFRIGLRGWLAALAGLVVSVGVVTHARAQVQEPRGVVRITLLSGDTLTGTLVERTGNEAVIEHPVFGRIAVPLESIREIAPATPVTPEEAEAAEPPAEEVEVESPWEIRFELGANGARGNSKRDNVRLAALGRRETDRMVTDLSMTYRYGTDSGETSENRFFALGRQQWKFTDSPWSYFIEGSVELDELKDFDSRVAASTGLGYRFIDTEDEKLTVRAGLGASKEFGSENDDIEPEAIAALDYLKRINDRTRFTFFAEYIQQFQSSDNYRARGEAALDFTLNNSGSWLLKLSVEDRYDNNPSGDAKRNDFFYGVSLVMVF